MLFIDGSRKFRPYILYSDHTWNSMLTKRRSKVSTCLQNKASVVSYFSGPTDAALEISYTDIHRKKDKKGAHNTTCSFLYWLCSMVMNITS